MKLCFQYRKPNIIIDAIPVDGDVVFPSELGVSFPVILSDAAEYTAEQRAADFEKSLKAKYQALKGERSADKIIDLDAV